MNQCTTWENEGLITTSRQGRAQVLQHSSANISQFRQAGYFWLTPLDFSHTVWPGRSTTPWQSCQHHHLKGLTFYWQSAFFEHIDSPNREHQTNNLLKAIVRFLGLAKHLVRVTQPCKTKLQSYFFEEKLAQLAQMMMNPWFPMANNVWNVPCSLRHVLLSERCLFHKIVILCF